MLDVGTGKGRLAIAFALARAKRVIAVDLSEDMLLTAAKNASVAGVGDIISFELGDAENLKYSDESFDIVCSIDTFLYLPHPQKGMNELGRVCKRGGMVVANIGNANYHYFTERVQSLLAKSNSAYGLVTGVYYSRLFSPVRKKLAQRYGWPVIRAKTCPEPLGKRYTREQFISFFQEAELKIENVSEYGGQIPWHFLVSASRP